MQIIGNNIILRLVEIDDASFVMNLRLNGQKAKFLSKVDDDVAKQKIWLSDYKAREMKGEEFYFIICSKTNMPCGTVRVYDFINESFSWGSWLINSKVAPFTAGIESALLIYEFAFKYLNLKKCHFEVITENTKVRSFHEKMGAWTSSSDPIKTYYEYDKDTYEKIKTRYIKYLPEGKIVCE